MKKIGLFIFIFTILTPLSGCSGKELDMLAIVTCIEISKTDDTYSVCAEIARLSDSESLPGKDTIVIKTTGDNLQDCISSLSEYDGRTLYFGHLRLIILNHSYTENTDIKDINELESFIMTNKEIRFNTLIASNNNDKIMILDAETFDTGNRGMDLSRTIESAGICTDLCDFINAVELNRDYINLPVFSLKDLNNHKTVFLNSDRIFRLPVS